MQDKGRSVVMGGFLILIGIWLLARALGVGVPGWDTLWPVILIGGALVSLYRALASDPREPDGVWFGVAGALAGGLFLYITAGQGEWGDMVNLWPWFPMAAGLGWLAAWLVRPREVAHLVLGGLALVGAGVGYLYTIGRLAPSVGPLLRDWWPLILVVIGLAYIIQYLVQRR
jgi:hypothetical protein